uniref:Serpentine receptor class gamma n=1 Tax=Caenorhabditis tropicalis TaxID=1561998 RepID=A0A1I7UGU5_9PELO
MYIITNHIRFAKSLTQIAMVLNRMSCVLMPVGYDTIWKKLTPVVWITLLVFPFTGTWNLFISRVYIGPTRGGFTMNYIKAVDWAALSMFQSIFILTALFFTVICTSITLYKLFMLPGRIKSIEKTLCISSTVISISFLLVAATQVGYCSHEITVVDSFIYPLLSALLATKTSCMFFNSTLSTLLQTGVVIVVTDKKLRDSILPCISRIQKGAVSPTVNRGRSVSLY